MIDAADETTEEQNDDRRCDARGAPVAREDWDAFIAFQQQWREEALQSAIKAEDDKERIRQAPWLFGLGGPAT
ncbi:hypothetical protein [Nocardia sp. NPDC004711]